MDFPFVFDITIAIILPLRLCPTQFSFTFGGSVLLKTLRGTVAFRSTLRTFLYSNFPGFPTIPYQNHVGQV